jgi:hypothetical protein
MVGGRLTTWSLCAAVAAAGGCSSGAGGGFDPTVAPAASSPSPVCGVATVVAQPMIWGLQLVVDGGQVYYTAYGAGADGHAHQLWSAPVGGGEPSLVWQGPSGILGSGLRVVDGRAFFSGQLAWDSADEGVMSVPLAGGAARVDAHFPTACAAYSGVAADDANVYAAANGCANGAGAIVAVPRGGGASRTLWSGDGAYVGAAAIAAGGGAVYFLLDDDDDGDGDAMKLDASGHATPLAIGTSREATALAADATGAWVTAGDALVHVPADGTPPVTLATHLAHPSLVAVDASGAYVVTGTLDDGPVGAVVRVPRDPGGAPQVLASQQPAIFALALDEGAVYWASQTGAMVARAGKCD